MLAGDYTLVVIAAGISFFREKNRPAFAG